MGKLKVSRETARLHGPIKRTMGIGSSSTAKRHRRHQPRRLNKAQIPWLLRGAIRSNNVETLKYLFSYPNRVDPSMVIDGMCPLNLAVELGYLQMVKILLKAGANIQVADAPRYPLHQASLFGRSECAELLIKSGASVSALTASRQSCLHLLASQSLDRFVKTAHCLLQHGANPNLLDDSGLAPLHLASVELIKTLASYDSTDLNVVSSQGDTPLLAAAKAKREACLLALLEADQQQSTTTVAESNPAVTTNHNPPLRTPLSSSLLTVAWRRHGNNQQRIGCSSSSTSSNPARPGAGGRPSSGGGAGESTTAEFRRRPRLEQLRANTDEDSRQDAVGDQEEPSESACQRCHSLGSNPNDISGWRKLGLLDRSQQQSADRHGDLGNPAVASSSCSATISRNHQTPVTTMTTPSVIAPPPTTIPSQQHSVQRRRNNSKRSRLDLDRRDKLGMTALMVSAETGNSGLGMIVGLVNAGASLDLIDQSGMTALHHACYVGSLNCVRLLLEGTLVSCSGGDDSTTNLHGDMTTNLTSDIREGEDDSTPPLMTNSTTSASGAVNNGDRSQLPPRRMLHLINCQDKYGRTPIYLAACRGHTQVVLYMLQQGADFRLANNESKSPLYISAYFGYLEIVDALLRRGAQVDHLDSHRKTPLYVATYHGRAEIVTRLLAKGANVNAVDKNGKSPLYVAVLHGHLQLARQLLRAGASIDRVDSDGLGPLHMAVKFPKLDLPMVKLLLEYGCDPVNLASFTRWLTSHNIIPQECISNDPQLVKWLAWEEGGHVQSLKRQCRTAFLRLFANCSDSHRRMTVVRRLTLPENLKAFLSVKEL